MWRSRGGPVCLPIRVILSIDLLMPFARYTKNEESCFHGNLTHSKIPLHILNTSLKQLRRRNLGRVKIYTFKRPKVLLSLLKYLLQSGQICRINNICPNIYVLVYAGGRRLNFFRSVFQV